MCWLDPAGAAHYAERMIVTDAVRSYLTGLRLPPDVVLTEMEAHAARERIPVVEPPTGALLHLLVRATGARRVVEIGTAIGVSTLYLARALPADGTVVSFEVDPARHAAARGYLERAGVLDRADLRLEDARAGLGSLESGFDLAFLDGVKAQYGDYLAAVVPLLRPGGLLAIDNALMSGTVAEGRGDGHWDDAQVAGQRALNASLVEHPELVAATVTPVGDGVALAVRR
jgi:predicted O-methyltransferase YrrM